MEIFKVLFPLKSSKFDVRHILFISRHYCSSQLLGCKAKNKISLSPEYIRNIGILAHIDAGKTTTTERMLYYSGIINNMGEVHKGNTVTDFMEQERQRGITITAASVSFNWGDYLINLIDTPGHIDFTMEVEQSLNVMDGAVVVLDASSGVEAQTATVWKQAHRFSIPRIIYVNKMDRLDGDYFSCIASINRKLDAVPLPLQLPFRQGTVFKGIVDLVSLKLKTWDETSMGSNIFEKPLVESDGQLWEDAVTMRQKLTDSLADLDDDLAEHIILEEVSAMSLSNDRLCDSIRKVTQLNLGFPVVCGSSYKNIGVQALMDAVTMFLPSAAAIRSESKHFRYNNASLCAKSFKVRQSGQKGPLTFVRIYSGKLRKNQKLYNLRLDGSEVATKLYMVTADEYTEVEEVGVGNICAVSGFKRSWSGDLFTSSASSASLLKKRLSQPQLEALNIVVPEPVFLCSIECPSQAYQATLDRALAELCREDPSLRVRLDEETGQTVLGGMGELHLDVIKERIRREYNVDVELGPLQIAYKEVLLQHVKDSHSVNLQIGNSHNTVTMTMSIGPSNEKHSDICLDRSPESAPNIAAITPKHLLALKTGALAALNMGPRLSCPVVNVRITLHWLEVGRGTSESVIASAANQCVKKLLAKAGTQLMEPIMQVEIACPADVMSSVIADLNRRRCEIDRFTSRGLDKVVIAFVPLAELVGYASCLRSVTSGQAAFSMQLHALKPMLPLDEAQAIKRITGLDPA